MTSARAMPNFDFETEYNGNALGIDEAGRGPLAGPVVAGAAWLDRASLPNLLRDGLDDSKKLSAKRRESLFEALQASPAVRCGIGFASVEEIDQINILKATHLAMLRAAQDLIGDTPWPAVALIDGNQAPKDFPCPTLCVVKGDSKSLSIAAASILAKVTRDRLMLSLDAKFPAYGWARNMGYGTVEHRTAISTHGITSHHRKSFGRQGELFG
jgi:ribonuclease HII